MWTNDAVPLAQWLTYTAVDATMIIVAAATTPHAEMAALELPFRAMLETLRMM